MRNLRDLGMGKSRLDGAIQDEARMLVRDFKNYDGQQVPLPKSFDIAVLNVVWQLVASKCDSFIITNVRTDQRQGGRRVANLTPLSTILGIMIKTKQDQLKENRWQGALSKYSYHIDRQT